MPPCLIACSVFRSAIAHIGIQQRHPELSMRYLPAHLHLQPVALKNRMLAEIRRIKAKGEPVGCIYGHCFEDIDELLDAENVPRIRIGHCFEILLGSERYRQTIRDQAGTFFMEKELVENFQAFCWDPLELSDPQIRQWYFEHYRMIAYIRQPRDPDLTAKLSEIAGALNLGLQVVKADYRELENALNDLIGKLDLK